MSSKKQPASVSRRCETGHEEMTKILFVCLGNICRSPSAEGIFAHVSETRATVNNYVVDSAAIADYHIGKQPDSRAIRAMKARGLDISNQKCRQISAEDFEHFDFLIAMDTRIVRSLEERSNAQYHEKILLASDFVSGDFANGIPDPFHGEQADFEFMAEQLFECCPNLLNFLEARLPGESMNVMKARRGSE